MPLMFSFGSRNPPANLMILKQRVKRVLEIALSWLTQNRLRISPTFLAVKPQRLRVRDTKVNFGTSTIKPVPVSKILGIHVDSTLSWEKHISHVTRRCYSILIGLSKLRHKIPRETKLLII